MPLSTLYSALTFWIGNCYRRSSGVSKLSVAILKCQQNHWSILTIRHSWTSCLSLRSGWQCYNEKWPGCNMVVLRFHNHVFLHNLIPCRNWSRMPHTMTHHFLVCEFHAPLFGWCKFSPSRNRFSNASVCGRSTRTSVAIPDRTESSASWNFGLKHFRAPLFNFE